MKVKELVEYLKKPPQDCEAKIQENVNTAVVKIKEIYSDSYNGNDIMVI